MSKETDKKRKDEEDPELDEEQDEEEEEEEDEEEEGEDSDEDEDEEEDDEEKDASADKSSKAAAADDADEADDEEDDEDDEEEDDAPTGTEGHEAHGDDEDPYWWTPHVVLGVLVLVGILGFFGMFNKPLAFLAAKPVAAPVTETVTAPQPAATPQVGAQPRPLPRPDQAQQPQREMFGAKHFLVMYKGGMRAPANVTRTKEEAKTRAEEGLKKIKGGAKFDEVVGEYSDEPGAGQRGGDLGTFPKGAMVPQFQEGLEKIKVGEVSGLVETPFGYHVILRTK